MKNPASRVAVLLFVALAGAAVAAQQAQPFRATVQTVPIYATVLDAAGRLVPSLEREHFEVFDNGKPQELSFFKSEVQPISVVVALDMSGSMVDNIKLATLAAEAFVLRLLPADRALIATFEDKVILGGAFTSNRDDLIRYLHTELQYGNGTLLWDAVEKSLAALSREQSRRVVLVLSDGDDFGSRSSLDQALKRAQTEDVMVYAIGLRSRYRGGPNGALIESRPDRGLKRLAEETGGGYFELKHSSELNSTFTRVADELHRQYVLGFSPAMLDDKLHLLDVRVKVPGMQARARKSYIARSEK